MNANFRVFHVLGISAFVALLAGCPGDDLTDVGDDGTGGTGGSDPGTEPEDPLDGGGSVPPSNRPAETDWASPSSLGNGLVHDTRVEVDLGTYTSTFSDAELAEGVAWSSFVDSNSAIVALGFRPAQVDGSVELTQDLEVVDRSVYISDDDANYRTEIFTHLFTSLASERGFDAWSPVALGARPTSIQTFATGGRVGYSVAWVYDSPEQTPKVPWVMKVGQTTAELEELLADPNFRPISLSSRRRGGVSEYAVILVAAESPEASPASLDVPTWQLSSLISERWDMGVYPFRITTEAGNSTRVNVLWTARPPGISVQPRVNLTDSTFADEDANWRSRGYHLETTDEYTEGGQQRRAAVWVRYEPYLRWEGTQFAAGDTNYSTKYQMFHDQTLRMMANMTEVDCSGGQPCPTGTTCYTCPGDFPCFYEDVCVETDFGASTHPSATLHIFEGSTLVLNRAYTFGPSIYPDTPINAPMKAASVSKSITSAAVIRELYAQGLTLNTSFHSAVGIFPDYTLLSGSQSGSPPVRVRDVLNHWGGFPGAQERPVSYANHAVIVAAGATTPVDGEELFDYVFGPPPGQVSRGIMDGDSYWEASWISAGQVRYSNAGYSLMGEMLRVQSGLDYADYVTEELLPPQLKARFFPDPGPRFATRGPTQTPVGRYLVDTNHPYNVAAQNPTPPQVGLNANPGDTWSPYWGPDDPRTPIRATNRYSGNRFLGGAPLAAGGWWADGEALGILIRTIVQSNTIFPQSLTQWLWHPGLWNWTGPVGLWAYVHGWYVRGNWVAWMGSDFGATTTVLHNRMFDVTVVFMTNGLDSPANFIDPLMTAPLSVFGASQVGQVWPCSADPNIGPTFTGCTELPVASIY